MTTATSIQDAFSIQLFREPDADDFRVTAVEVFHSEFKHRLVFSKHNSIGDVFTGHLASYIREALAGITSDRMVVSKPDAILDLPNLVLGRLRMLVTTSAKGAKQVILRFAYFIGGIQSAFSPKTYFPETVCSHRERLAVQALESICLPLLDIVGVSQDEELTRDKIPSLINRLDQIVKNQDELRFYSELLVRYVSHAAREPLAKPEKEQVLGVFPSMSAITDQRAT